MDLNRRVYRLSPSQFSAKLWQSKAFLRRFTT